MNRWTRNSTRLAAVAGLATVVAIGLATPAFANPAPGHTSSFGVLCGGVVTCGPFAQSAFPEGPASNSLASLNVAGVSTGLINTSANSNEANASVNDLSVNLGSAATLPSTLAAQTVSSQCSITSTGGVTGSTSIVNGQVLVFGGPRFGLETNPAPNTAVAAIPGVTSIILNRQTTAPDGTLTVDAIYITLLSGQTYTIASSSCTPTGTGIPMASGTGLLIGGGLLGLLVLGYAIRRRSLSARHRAA